MRECDKDKERVWEWLNMWEETETETQHEILKNSHSEKGEKAWQIMWWKVCVCVCEREREREREREWERPIK